MKQQEGVDWFQAKHEGEGSLLIEFIRGGPGFQRASIDQGHPLIFDGETIAALTAEGYLRLHVAARSNTLVTFELKDLEYLGQFHEAACPHSDHLIDREAQDPDSDDYVGWQHDCREEILQRPVSIIGSDIVLGFNDAARKKIEALARAPHTVVGYTVDLLFGALYSNCDEKGPDPKQSAKKAHRSQARGGKKPRR